MPSFPHLDFYSLPNYPSIVNKMFQKFYLTTSFSEATGEKATSPSNRRVNQERRGKKWYPGNRGSNARERETLYIRSGKQVMKEI